MNWVKNHFCVTCDPAKLDLNVISEFLASSYWAKGIPSTTVEKSLKGSFFALLDGVRQIGFARVISDRATIAYLGDVFILPEYRGRGLSKWLLACVMEHPELQGLRRWILATSDAHELYKKYGFTELKKTRRVYGTACRKCIRRTALHAGKSRTQMNAIRADFKVNENIATSGSPPQHNFPRSPLYAMR